MRKFILIYGMSFALIAAGSAAAQIPAQVQINKLPMPFRTPVQDSASAPPSDIDLRMARFFAGAALIRNTPLASDEDRARFYRELEVVCGVTGKDASAFLNQCRRNPDEWTRISNLTITLLTNLAITVPDAAPKTAVRKKGKLWAGQ